jgi:methylglyoxal reductase
VTGPAHPSSDAIAFVTSAGGVPFRALAQSGIQVSEIGIGCWAIGGADWNLGLPMGWGGTDDQRSLAGLERAYELGANHFDTADVYGHGHSERLLGQLVQRVPRDRIVVGTKVGYFSGTAPNPYHPLNIRHQLEMSLCNLRTDYVDIYYFHNFNFGASREYLDDAVAEMRRFREEGKVKAIGMRGPHRFSLDRAHGTVGQDKYEIFFSVAEKVRPDVVQIRFNLLTPSVCAERDVFSWANSHGVGVVINKPLAQGLLLDKYDPLHPPDFEVGDHRRRKRWFGPEGLAVIHRRMSYIRERFGNERSDLVRVALQYCLHQSPNACVVAGVKGPEQVEMNLRAAGRPLLEEDVRFLQQSMAEIGEEIGAFFVEEERGAQQAVHPG